MKDNFPFVSLIVPCYQEINFITQFLNSVTAQDYPQDKMEIIIADGNSTDGTREIIGNYFGNNKYIKLIDNPQVSQTHGLNLACLISHGDIIIRLDVHATYPTDYVSTLVSAQRRLNAWNVGCVMQTKPSANTLEANVVSAGLSSTFGVGNSLYRVGIKNERLVDTVPFGCFPKRVLENLGYYNPEFIVNEDEELNARIKKAGGKIYLLPYPTVNYYARDTKGKLFKMLFKYGFFKPKVDFSVGSIITSRQVIPPIFVFYLFITPLSLLFRGTIISYLFFIPVSIYALLLFFFSGKIAFNLVGNFKKHKVFLQSIICFSGMHLSYGFGYIKGLLHLLYQGYKYY
jgi:glycosyltransferase involved in cell wall biosynthesis